MSSLWITPDRDGNETPKVGGFSPMGICRGFMETMEAAGIEPAFPLPNGLAACDIERRRGFVL